MDDWFGRERGLGEAEAANLVYAADFDANEIELLELPDDLLQRAREGEELVFKGGPDEEAVLCTSDATYRLKRVETSNTLLLMRGASGAIDDRREDEAEADETDEADATQTPSAATVKRRRVSETSNAGGPVTPVTEPRPARTVAAFAANEDGSPTSSRTRRRSRPGAHRTEPRLERAWRALAAPPHAFAGNDEPETTTELGLTEETILSLARASKGETLAALEIGPAFLDPATNRWRGVDEGYLDHLLDVLCVAADANGWPLSAVPSIEMCDALVLDGFPKPLTAYAIARFFERVETSDDEKQTEASTFAARAASTARSKPASPGRARERLEWLQVAPGRVHGEVARVRARALPRRLRCVPACRLALVEKAVRTRRSARRGRRLKASSFPREPKARFAALFAVKPRWTLAELTPYVQANAEMTVEAQLLKFTRVTQPDAKATATYSKR